MISEILMINFDDYANKDKTMQELRSHNLKWLYIPDHPYRILIIGGFRIWKNKCIIKFNKQPARY